MPIAAELRELLLPLNGSYLPSAVDELFLLREMNHRFANTLTLLICQFRSDPESFVSSQFRDLIARAEARIVAFSKLHRSLMIGAANTSISVQDYVEHLCTSLSEAVLEPMGVRCEVTVDTGIMPAARCELLGLVIAELVTNSAKHAFPNRDGGVVRVKLGRKDQLWVCIVSDNGEVTNPTPQGTGTKIIGQLVRLLGGSLVRNSGRHGTSVVVIFPCGYGTSMSKPWHIRF
jgi:two-component sensor histidine kinase